MRETCVTILFLSLAAAAQAAQPTRSSEQCLPATTRVFVSIPHPDRLKSAWEQVPLGKLASESRLAPLVHQVRETIEAAGRFQALTGLKFHEWLDCTTGELCVAIVASPDGKPVHMVLANVSENAAQVTGLVERRLATRSPGRTTPGAGGVSVRVFDVPLPDGKRGQTAYAFVGQVLVASSHLPTLVDVLKRFSTVQPGSLGSLDSFRSVFARCGDTGGTEPHLRWFVDPIGLQRLYPPATRNKHELTLLRLADRHGFDALRAVGGTLSFATDDTTFLARIAVEAPRPYRQAMQMLSFPGGDRQPPPAWVPNDVHSVATLRCRLSDVVDHAGGPLDDALGDGLEGTFEDILSDVKSRLRVDVRRDLVAHLGPRITIFSDTVTPITPKSNRLLVAIETKDEGLVAQALERLHKDDRGIRRHRLPGFPHALYQVPDDKKATFPNLAMMVANKHLLITHDAGLLRKALEQNNGPGVAGADDYRRVTAKLEQLHDDDACLRLFIRPDRSLLAPYELLRQKGKELDRARDAKLVKVTSTGDRAVGFKELPEFKLVAQYLGSLGVSAKQDDRGWTIVAVGLKTEPQPPTGAVGR